MSDPRHPPTDNDPSVAYIAYQEAQRRITDAALENKVYLSLSNLGLASVPSEIGQLVNLTTLELHGNQLTSIPSEIGQLAKLATLSLSDNQLRSVPPEIGQLANLTKLYLSKNQLRSVPPEIGRLANLTRLYLFDNYLTSVPPEIGQLANLVQLHLDDNQLMSLPDGLDRLPQLAVLFLHGNPKLDLPASVLGVLPGKWNGREDTAPKPGPILDYYFRTNAKTKRRTLCEGKLILVGRGDVGKTSLVRRLIDNTFSRGEDTTQGIRIRKLPVVAGETKDTIQMHVWDFGGQEIMHATHQLFLTDRSLYLVVLDGRAGQQEAEADYWLRLIASVAPESPVLVVLNKIKKDHFTINRGALQQKFSQVVGFVETDCDNPGSDKQPSIDGHGIETLRAAIATHVDQLPDIRQAFPNSWFDIKEELSKPDRSNFLTISEYRALCTKLGEPNPESQMNLSLFLHRLGIALNFCDDPRLHDKHVLNPHWLTNGIYDLLTSKTLADRKGELTPADLAQELDTEKYPAEMHPFLINLMEKFELCFSFEDQPEKTSARAKKVAEVVAPQTPTLAEKYLIPELLDPEQPAAAAELFDESKCLNFHYRYSVLPPGLLPRFIVRTHVLSEEHRWKTGVILNFEDNTALVKADPQDKTIRVLINGPPAGRRRMLGMIRQDFDVIHRDIPHLKPDELVSFPSHPQLTVTYAKLEVLFNKDPNKTIDEVFDGDVVTATVRELLEGVEFEPLGTTIRSASAKDHASRGSALGHEGEPGSRPLRVFYSYARVDAKLRLKLSKHLSLWERTGLIQTWYDNEILPGAEFDKDIANKLAEADIVLLLISADFLSSKYCVNIEIPAAMKRRAEAGVAVIPIIIREVEWRDQPAGETTLGKLNALPSSGKPVPDWPTRDKAWANIAAGIKRIAEDLRKR